MYVFNKLLIIYLYIVLSFCKVFIGVFIFLDNVLSIVVLFLVDIIFIFGIIDVF